MLATFGDPRMAPAERSDVREYQSFFLDAREALTRERANLMADFERHLRELVDERISGKGLVKADFSAVDARKLTLVDTEAMDESVLSCNIGRVVENACHEELRERNRGVGFLMGEPNLKPPPIRWRRRRSSPRLPKRCTKSRPSYRSISRAQPDIVR